MTITTLIKQSISLELAYKFRSLVHAGQKAGQHAGRHGAGGVKSSTSEFEVRKKREFLLA